MVLAIDIGNTRSKAAVFDDSSILSVLVFDAKTLKKQVADTLRDIPRITDIVISSVLTETFDRDSFPSVNVHTISNSCDFPFTNLYATPLTLGIDRMVLASGAVLKFPHRNRLVIDAGTCITYDFIDEQDNYHGGAISPGIQLRYHSLHNFTAKLPLLNCEIPKSFIGNTTAESIHSGVINGVVNEIEGFISQYEQNFSNFIIILTGGDGDFLAKRLKNTIFANSNFLLESLNQTFQYKNQQ